MPTHATATAEQGFNFYQILGLQQPAKGAVPVHTKDAIRSAYHRTLLCHHPDKVATAGLRKDTGRDIKTREDKQQFSIDQIVEAYQTLSTASAKILYDQHLIRAQSVPSPALQHASIAGPHLGIEVHDLDDLAYDEREHSWSRPCRCGNGDGYVVTEAELEQESEEGEIYIGCKGCSLFIKVFFSAAAEAVEDEHDN